MKLELKNNESIDLEIGPLFLEYLDDYEGGINQLLDDWKNNKNILYIVNYFTYAVIASNYDKPISYRDSLRLVKFEDIDKIASFVANNITNIENHIVSGKLRHF